MNVIDQIYNAAAMLPGQAVELDTACVWDRMERHKLLTSIHRIRVALGQLPAPVLESDAAAEAYMAGYEDESK